MSTVEAIESVLTGRQRACIVEGDCRSIIPMIGSKCVAATIMDPPYEAEAHTSARRQRQNGKVETVPLDFDAIDDATRTSVARAVCDVTRGWAVGFCQVEAVARWRDAFGESYWGPMCWVKPDGAPNFAGNGPGMGFECLAVAWCGSGRSEWNGGGRRGVLTHNVGVFGGEKNWHRTQKPISLMRELIELFTQPDDIVLDAFCGSGSTGVAALQLGRRFIGIEILAKNVDIARGRLRAEVDGVDYRKALQGQTSLFAWLRDR